MRGDWRVCDWVVTGFGVLPQLDEAYLVRANCRRHIAGEVVADRFANPDDLRSRRK